MLAEMQIVLVYVVQLKETITTCYFMNTYKFSDVRRLFQLWKIVCAQLPSHVWLFATPWTVAHQAPLP